MSTPHTQPPMTAVDDNSPEYRALAITPDNLKAAHWKKRKDFYGAFAWYPPARKSNSVAVYYVRPFGQDTFETWVRVYDLREGPVRVYGAHNMGDLDDLMRLMGKLPERS